jgi:outer membrane protein TolC
MCDGNGYFSNDMNLLLFIKSDHQSGHLAKPLCYLAIIAVICTELLGLLGCTTHLLPKTSTPVPISLDPPAHKQVIADETSPVSPQIQGSSRSNSRGKSPRASQSVKRRVVAEKTTTSAGHGVIASEPSSATATQQVLTLEKAIEIALKNNPVIAAKRWQISAAEAQRQKIFAEHFPTIIIAGAYRHHWHDERLVPARSVGGTVSFSRNIFSGDLILTIPLFAGGRVKYSVDASKSLEQAAKHQLTHSREELIYKVKTTYYAIIGHQLVIRSLLQAQKTLQEHLRGIQALLQARKASKVDILNTEVKLAELEYLLVKQKGVLQITQRMFASLLGYKDRSVEISSATQLSEQAPTLDIAHLVSLAIQNRADMRELQANISAQAQSVRAVRAEYWPIIALKGMYGGRLSAEGQYDDLGFVGLELFLPIFTGLSTQAKVRLELAKLKVLQEHKNKLLLDIRQEIESVVIQIKTADAQIKASHKSIEKAKESLRITRERAKLGHATNTDVLDAQTSLLRAETSHYAAIIELQSSLAMLVFYTGK